MPLSSIEYWTINNKTKQKIDIPITSTIDYYPFPITYSKHKKQTNKTKKSISNSWKLISNKHDFEDSIDSKVPILTRKIDKNTEQTLVIYRDMHHNMSNMRKIQTLINTYKPDKIIIAWGPDAASVGLNAFLKLRYRLVIMPVLKIRQLMIRKSNERSVGERWMQYFVRKLCALPSSYTLIKTIDIAIKNKIPIVCSDYPERHIVPLSAFAEALDKYQRGFFEMMKFPVKKLEKLDSILPRQFARICGIRLQPHQYIVAGHKNDMMSLGINECVENKLLFIAAEGYCYDIIDRLCGNVEITNPFKNVEDKRVVLKDMPSDYYVGHSKVDIGDLSDEDVEKARKWLGDDALLMLVPNKQYATVDDIKYKLGNISKAKAL